MQKLFQNESVGRVLVADYTTKADFVIPDINRVIGPGKYEVINRDIKDGLQNVILNEDTYSGATMKARVFLDRLKEAREAFISDFLQPEVRRIAKDLGFRSYPTVKFKDIDLRDEIQLMRISTRLMELGILTAEQGMEILQTGRFPKPEELDGAQEKFVEQRKKGHFNPIVGGIPMIEDDDAPVEPADQQKVPGQPGRPLGTTEAAKTISKEAIQATVYEVEALQSLATQEIKAKTGKKRLNKQQKEMISKLCESVVCGSSKENWTSTMISCVNDYNHIESLSILNEIYDVSDVHKLEIYPAAILYHSNERNK